MSEIIRRDNMKDNKLVEIREDKINRKEQNNDKIEVLNIISFIDEIQSKLSLVINKRKNIKYNFDENIKNIL